MVAERPAGDDAIARAHVAVAEHRPRRDDADAAGDGVDAVALAAQDDLGVAGDELDARLARGARYASTTVWSSAVSQPSSRISAQESHRGRAPETARSLTVPQTER